MTAAAAPWLLAGIPLAGALLSLFAWANAARLRTSAVLVSAITFGAAIGLTGRLASPPEGALLLYLLPVAACVSLLGQPLHHDHRLSWVATLLLLGLGLGVLALPTIGGPLFLMLLLGCLIALLYRYHTPLWPISWLGIGTYGFGAMCAAVSMIAGRPFSAAAQRSCRSSRFMKGMSHRSRGCRAAFLRSSCSCCLPSDCTAWPRSFPRRLGPSRGS